MIAWTLTEGDITRKLDGFYELLEGDEPGSTEVTYQLTVDVKIPMLGFAFIA